MSAWTPALRIARRGVKRNLGRSILIAALIAIPVAGATLVDVLARTLSAPAREAERNLGAADAQIGGVQFKRISMTGQVAETDYRPFLPKGTRIVPAPTSKPIVLGRDGGTLTLTDPDGPALPGASGKVAIMGQTTAVLVAADPNEPMHRQALGGHRGPRAARSRARCWSHSTLADRLTSRIGTKIQAAGETLTVIGDRHSPRSASAATRS